MKPTLSHNQALQIATAILQDVQSQAMDGVYGPTPTHDKLHFTYRELELTFGDWQLTVCAKVRYTGTTK